MVLNLNLNSGKINKVKNISLVLEQNNGLKTKTRWGVSIRKVIETWNTSIFSWCV